MEVIAKKCKRATRDAFGLDGCLLLFERQDEEIKNSQSYLRRSLGNQCGLHAEFLHNF